MYEAFAKGDMAGVSKVSADDIVWRWPGRHPLARDGHSREQLFETLGQIAQETSGTFRIELRDVVGFDGRVVALLTVQAERNGRRLSVDGVHVFRVENGKAVEALYIYDDPYAVDEFFS
jgi:uncharacterized protein